MKITISEKEIKKLNEELKEREKEWWDCSDMRNNTNVDCKCFKLNEDDTFEFEFDLSIIE